MSLNKQQQEIYNTIAAGHNVAVLDSEGGTGKSYLLKKLQEDFSHNTIFLSSTGVSAIAIGGMTFHRALSIPLGFPTPEDLRKVSSITSKLFAGNAIQRIVVDEAGMLTTFAWYTCMHRLQRFNKPTKKRDARQLQVVLLGDLLQLGSIYNDTERKMSIDEFGTDKFFKMKSFKGMDFKFMNLNTVVRQTDIEMKGHLSNIRRGNNLTEGIEYFNNKCYRYPLPQDCTIITTTNKKVDEYNNQVFFANRNPCGVFEATIKGRFPEKDYPVEYSLRLKVGLKVMTLRNDREDRWVNGSTGVVTAMSSDGVEVLFDHSGETHVVPPQEYEKHAYETVYNEETEMEELSRYVDATFTQIPLRQCSAISGHKSQGATISKAIIDLGRGSGWADGLLYVMLSRLTDTSGLYLKRKIRVTDVATNEETVEWLDLVRGESNDN